MVTGNGGGISKGIRREIERQLELDKHRVVAFVLVDPVLVCRRAGVRQPTTRSLIFSIRASIFCRYPVILVDVFALAEGRF